MAERESNPERKVIKEGYFGVRVTTPDNKTVTLPSHHQRRLEVAGDLIVLTDKWDDKVTILPPGSKVQTFPWTV